MGGKFASGFISAAAAKFASTYTRIGDLAGAVAGKGFHKVITRTAVAAVVGGTVSSLSGGDFANGAYTAAFQHLFNQEARVKANQARTRAYAKKMQRGIADGHLTLEEANFHYRNGNGAPVDVDVSKLDFSNVDVTEFSYNKTLGAYTMNFSFNKVTKFYDWAVHGNMTLKLVNPTSGAFRVYHGPYDFGMHKYSGGAKSHVKTFARNQLTKVGDFVARGTGSGTQYLIRYNGTVTP